MIVSLPHQLTVTTPGARTDEYGNTAKDWATATSGTVRAYVQPVFNDETSQWPREALSTTLRVFTLEPLPATGRATWQDVDYEVDGHSQQWDSPRGVHHYETMLRRVDG